MAYRLPTERRDRTNDATTLSYLEHFLEQIESLPGQTKSAFSEIRHLDDKLDSLVANAQVAADEAMQRSATKGVAIETARRTYHEFIHNQTSAKEVADKKLALATSIHASTDSVITELDRRLLEFEAQLKRDGRWPGANPQPATQPTTPDQPKAVRSPTAKAPRADNTNSPPATQPLNTRAAQKARNREVAASPPLVTPRTRNTPTASRGATVAVNVPPSKPEPTAKEVQHTPARAADVHASEPVEGNTTKTGTDKVPATERLPDRLKQEPDKVKFEKPAPSSPSADVATSRDGNDGVSVDETLYCSCQRVSHGDMIACEGKNCPFEWYHFECVGLKEAPEGSWICPTCKEKEKEKEKKRKSVTKRFVAVKRAKNERD